MFSICGFSNQTQFDLSRQLDLFWITLRKCNMKMFKKIRFWNYSNISNHQGLPRLDIWIWIYHFMRVILVCNNTTKILLILSDKRLRPTKLWPNVSTKTGFFEIISLLKHAWISFLCWVSRCMSDNYWQYSLNSINESNRFQRAADIPTDLFTTETKWTYNSPIRIFLHISITNWLVWRRKPDIFISIWVDDEFH